MRMNTYVNFAGKCAEPFRFYEERLGGRIGVMLTHAQSPVSTRTDPSWANAILHARVTIAGTELMGADIPHAAPMRSA